MDIFSSFENQWTITGIIRLASAFRIGGGQNAAAYSLSASPVIQSYNAEKNMYLPVILGSSLKGVLRTGVERLVRSFKIEESCVALTSDRDVKRLCGNCVTCGLFGSMKRGSKICVDDAQIPAGDIKTVYDPATVHEQPHYASSSSGPAQRGRREGLLRSEETVAAGTRFEFRIRLDNATKTEAGLILLALQEFNEKRLQIGGAVSRGLGFIDVIDLKVEKASVGESGKISSMTANVKNLKQKAKEYLTNIDAKKDSGLNDFSVYAFAHERISPGTGQKNGHTVARFTVITRLPFKMAGFDESTVTNYHEPYIPGSTIKGFLRHRFAAEYEDKNAGAQQFSGGKGMPHSPPRPSRTDEIFGDTRNHRSRILVSDAFSMKKVTANDEIPINTILQMWMVFDNMQGSDIDKILNLIKEPVVITGSKSAGIDRRARRFKPTHNLVEFTLDPKDVTIFRTDTYLIECDPSN
ncbi:MAG: RAMP superfamily protein [Methanoregula sp. PtaU1.Bin051]|nr:MAG: RAMP superfamily protein [Methanoregula sp. PtaU1.Bin051]